MNNPNLSSNPSGSVVAPVAPKPFGPAAPGTGVGPGSTSAYSPNPQAPTPVSKKSRRGHIIETVILVFVSIIAVTFIGLFVWKYTEWETVRTDVDGQIDAAVAIAVADNTTQLEAEFLEREKYPYKTFTGPADYGSLSFEYPKTWNVYIAKDTSSGGDFEAYLNPGEVQPVSNSTINSLRVIIRDTAYDQAVRQYDNLVKNGKATMITRNVGSTIANVYTGELPSKIQGIVTIFKLRDKTVLIQTDAMLFSDEYYKLLDTVTFIE